MIGVLAMEVVRTVTVTVMSIVVDIRRTRLYGATATRLWLHGYGYRYGYR